VRVLVDTNVVLDFFLSREPERESVTTLFEQIYKEKVEAFATASGITDIYYIMAKRLGNDKAREAIYHLLSILEIIPVDGYDCGKALDFPITDFEDALAAICAIKAGVGYIISHDKNFLSADISLTPVITAREFLKVLYA
jgi:predicted nucleic acid-binding protein